MYTVRFAITVYGMFSLQRPTGTLFVISLWRMYGDDFCLSENSKVILATSVNLLVAVSGFKLPQD